MNVATRKSGVDTRSRTRESIEYLDAARATEAAKTYKRQSLARLGIMPGHHVLDVGCGPGDDVRDIAELVGSQGRAVGIDGDYQMIAEAWRRLGSPHSHRQVEFRVGDAHNLPFDDGAFDGCRSDRVFQHLKDPALALKEMVRVARPGAVIVISEPDWEMLAVDTSERSVTRRVVQFIADNVTPQGWIGRQLHRLFKERGLTDVYAEPAVLTVTSFELADRLWGLVRHARASCDLGLIEANEMTRWLGELEAAGKASQFFCAHLGFVVSGRKP